MLGPCREHSGNGVSSRCFIAQDKHASWTARNIFRNPSREQKPLLPPLSVDMSASWRVTVSCWHFWSNLEWRNSFGFKLTFAFQKRMSCTKHLGCTRGHNFGQNRRGWFDESMRCFQWFFFDKPAQRLDSEVVDKTSDTQSATLSL